MKKVVTLTIQLSSFTIMRLAKYPKIQEGLINERVYHRVYS